MQARRGRPASVHARPPGLGRTFSAGELARTLLFAQRRCQQPESLPLLSWGIGIPIALGAALHIGPRRPLDFANGGYLKANGAAPLAAPARHVLRVSRARRTCCISPFSGHYLFAFGVNRDAAQ